LKDTAQLQLIWKFHSNWYYKNIKPHAYDVHDKGQCAKWIIWEFLEQYEIMWSVHSRLKHFIDQWKESF
jgi:hypothetical protein